MCKQISEAGLSVRETERMVQDESAGIDSGAALSFPGAEWREAQANPQGPNLISWNWSCVGHWEPR